MSEIFTADELKVIASCRCYPVWWSIVDINKQKTALDLRVRGYLIIYVNDDLGELGIFTVRLTKNGQGVMNNATIQDINENGLVDDVYYSELGMVYKMTDEDKWRYNE